MCTAVSTTKQDGYTMPVHSVYILLTILNTKTSPLNSHTLACSCFIIPEWCPM